LTPSRIVVAAAAAVVGASSRRRCWASWGEPAPSEILLAARA
jgi:hypothetical protein